MLRFQHIEFLWLLGVIPLLILIYFLWVRNRTRKMAQIGDIGLVSKLMPSYSAARNRFRFILICLSVFFAVVGLANLQSGARSEKIQRKGIDVVIALDVSKSMLATDVAPDRLEKAKQLIFQLLEKLGNNRIGLIVFAGRAYNSVPLTIDLAALKMNLATTSPDQIPTQGTVLGEAVRMARHAFNTKETKYKSIVLISDGEDHDAEVMDEVKAAVGEGIMINTVGVGSVQGSPIRDPETNENKKDEQGQDIISKLNEDELKQIALAGQGVYTHLTNTESSTQAIATQINTIEQKNFGDSLFVDYNSYFQYFLLISLLLLLCEYFIPKRTKISVV